jgi:hypothetical protein
MSASTLYIRTLTWLVTVLLASAAAGAQTKPVSFTDFVSRRLSAGPPAETPSRKIDEVCPIGKSLALRRIFHEYGAIFAAAETVQVPPTCIFKDGEAVTTFQWAVPARSELVGGVAIKLQERAMDSLIKLTTEAELIGIDIVPFDGAIAGSRTYLDTVRIWNSRFQPALDHWVRHGKIDAEAAQKVRSLALSEQLDQVIRWEGEGLWFGTGRAGSIFSSTAPPGSSQHLSMLAFDVAGNPSRRVRELFNKYGWFQTVRGDPQHFTYLGLKAEELPQRGLRPVVQGGVAYWVPNIDEAPAVIPSN